MVPGSCSCPTGLGTTLVDCNGDPVEECSCPEVESCAQDIGCEGTRSCTGQQCGSCECGRFLAAGEGTAVELVGDGEDVYMRLASAPWLLRLRNEELSPVGIAGDLGWVEQTLIAADGGVVVLGTLETPTVRIQLQRFSSAGEPTGSSEIELSVPQSEISSPLAMPQAPATVFAGAALLAGDTVRVAALVRGGFSSFLMLVDVDQRGSLGEPRLGPRVGGGGSPASIADRAVGGGGEIYLAGHLEGGSSVEAAWFLALDAAGEVSAEHVDTAVYERNRLEIAPGPDAGFYAGWWWRPDHQANVEVSLARFGPSGLQWSHVLSDTVTQRFLDLATLRDSVLAVGDGAEGRDVLMRAPADGGSPRQLDLPRSQLVLAQDSRRIIILRAASGDFVLEAYQLAALAEDP